MKNPRPYCTGFCLLLLMFCFAMTGTSVALNQYYIAPTGSDSNDGSAAHPWRTINHADAALTVGAAGVCTAGSGWSSASGVGACVHVASGTYSGAIITNKNGASQSRIRYISDTQYGARLTGGGVDPVWLPHGKYIDIVGFEFDGSLFPTQRASVITYAAEAPTNLSFLNNKVHDFSSACNQANGPSAVSSGALTGGPATQASNDNIEGNLIYHNNCGFGQSTVGNSEAGINVGWGDLIQNNIVLDQGGSTCISATHGATHAVITNNTVANCDGGGIFLANQYSLNDYSTVTNNIIVNNGASGHDGGIRIYASGGCGPHNIYANNLIYGNVGGDYIFDSPCPNTSTGTRSGSNSTTFVNYTGTISGDYHLRTGSSAIGTGTTSCALSGCVSALDFAGNARLQALDIGSYAFTVTGAPAAPIGLTATAR